MSFGQTLRAAREAKGITPSELAKRTHILVQIVEGLENEDFRKIAAPIYGRGFVKLYCETVGLDPKPFQAEFMAIYARMKDGSAIDARPAPQQPHPKLSPLPPPPAKELELHKTESSIQSEEPIPDMPPKAIGDLFPSAREPTTSTAKSEPEKPDNESPESPESIKAQEPAPETNAQRIQESTNEMPPRRSYGDLFEQAYAKSETEKPSAAEKFRDTMSNVSHGVFSNVKKLPPNTGRMAVVGVAAAILLALICWGVTALYKATTPQTEVKEEASKPEPAKVVDAKSNDKAAPPSEKAKPIEKPVKLKSSGIQIPPLYID